MEIELLLLVCLSNREAKMVPGCRRGLPPEVGVSPTQGEFGGGSAPFRALHTLGRTGSLSSALLKQRELVPTLLAKQLRSSDLDLCTKPPVLISFAETEEAENCFALSHKSKGVNPQFPPWRKEGRDET